jgi:hypothetical protein
MAQITYEDMMQHVEQLSADEKTRLMEYLLAVAKERQLTSEEKWALFRVSVISAPVNGDFSNRRVDWYDDDGR